MKEQQSKDIFINKIAVKNATAERMPDPMILQQYSMQVRSIANIKFKDSDKPRAVYKLETDRGDRCLKKVFYDEGNLLFVYSVTEWLNLNGLHCPRLISTIDGHKYVKHQGSLYILTDWINGRKCSYDNMQDIQSISLNLARMHKTSKGFVPIPGSSDMSGNATFFTSLEKHTAQLQEFYHLAAKSRDSFSNYFLYGFSYQIARAQRSVQLIRALNFSAPLGDSVSMKAICHLDYVNKNIIFSGEHQWNVIDFDNTRLDMPVHDISFFLKRIMKREKTEWNFEVFLSAMKSYEKVRNLSWNERILLYALLSFPQKFWKVSRDYYNNIEVVNPQNYIKILRRINDGIYHHNAFCNQYEEYYGLI